VTGDLQGPNSKIHLLGNSVKYNPYQVNPPLLGNQHIISSQFVKFANRTNPLICAMRASGAVVFAKRKFLASLKKRSIGSYENGRDVMAKEGLWLLAAESAEEPGPHLSKLRPILRDMEVLNINYKGVEIPVAVGRQIRKNISKLKRTRIRPPQYFNIKLLKKDSPLASLIVRDFHRLGHNISPNDMLKECVREGFLWPGCEDTFKKFNDDCMWCTAKRAAFRKMVSEQAILGPDATVEHLTSKDILDVVVIDQTGPYSLRGRGSETFSILMCVELTTILSPCHKHPSSTASKS